MTEGVPNLKRRPLLLVVIIGACGAALAVVGAFLIYDRVTGAPDPEIVCADLQENLHSFGTAATVDAIRAHYPPGLPPPPPGTLVELVGGARVSDTPANLCLHQLSLWKQTLDRDPYVTLVKCVHHAGTLDSLHACYGDGAH